MKRFFLLLIAAVMLISSAGCSVSIDESKMNDTLTLFTNALKVYDRDAMTLLVTEFPDKTEYVYLDDIFNDEPYINLYRILFSDITYEIKSCEKNRIIAEFTMPNVQQLYSTVLAEVFQMVMSNEELQAKLDEDDQNGVILTQEMMLSLAINGEYETMIQEFTLTFKEKEDRVILVCDDQFRALITGNFFLSRNISQSDVNG